MTAFPQTRSSGRRPRGRSALRWSLAASLCTAISFGAASGFASVDPAFDVPVPVGFDEVVALATEKIDIEKEVIIVSGSLVGNDEGAEIKIKSNSSTASGFTVRSDKLDIEKDVVTHGAFFCNDLDDKTNTVTCGSLSTPVYLVFPIFQSASPGSDDIKVEDDESLTFSPQAIGKLELEKRTTLILTGGVYDIEELKTKEGAEILFQGPTVLRIKKKIELDKEIYFGPETGSGLTAADIRVYGEDGLAIKEDSIVRASFYTPDAKVDIEKDVTFTGALLAKEISVKERSTLTLESAFQNVPPIAAGDGILVSEGGATSTLVGGATSVLANDSDPNNDNLFATTTLLDVPDHGVAVLAADGTFTYSHNGSENFTDSFVYEVCDDGVAPGPLCAIATVAITITPVNDAPVAVDDTFTVDEGASGTSATVLGNDSDADDIAGVLTVTLNGAPPAFAASFNLATDGTFTYEHDGTENFSTSFVYTVCDDGTDPPGVLCDDATVSITINPINDAPIAIDDTLTLDEGATASVSVLDNDTDADDSATALTVSLDGAAPTNGNLTLGAGGVFTYEHDGTETFSASFDYEVCDDGSDPPGVLCDVGTVTITINPVNDAPVAVPDTFTVDEGGTATALDNTDLSVLDNDTDAEGDGLTATLLSGPSNGSLTLNGDGTFSYSHDGSETTSDSFGYQVCDDGTPQECDDTTVTITVNPVNDDPTGDDQTITVGLPTTITMTGSDAEGDALTFSILTPPPASEGTLGPVTPIDATSASVQFTPGVSGDGDAFDTGFVFQVADGNGGFGTGNVSITVLGSNSPPVTRTDAIRVNNGGTATTLINGATSLLANDFDPDGDGLVLQATPVSGPSNGTVTLFANGTFSYTHNGSATTTDAFVYQVCDDGSPSLCSNGQVGVQVLAGSITVTLAFFGDGGGTVTSSPGGLSCTEGTASCSATLSSPDRIVLSATPAPGSAFAGFGGDADCSDGSLLVDTDKNCEVTFNAVPPPPSGFFNLTVGKTGTGTGTVTSSPPGIDCGPSCNGVFPAFTRIELLPAPSPGSVFVNWNGTADCLDGLLIRNPGADASCVAVFDAIVVPPSLSTLTVVVAGAGTVRSSTGGITCTADSTCTEDVATGDVVTLFARGSGGSFVGWSGACVGSSPIVNVTVDAAKTCTATFTP